MYTLLTFHHSPYSSFVLKLIKVVNKLEYYVLLLITLSSTLHYVLLENEQDQLTTQKSSRILLSYFLITTITLL